MPILSPILAHARSSPYKIAVASLSGVMTYGELADKALHVRHRLNTLSRRADDDRLVAETITALSLGNISAFFPVFAAATSGGHVLAVIPPSLPEDVFVNTLVRLKPDCVFADFERGERVKQSGELDPGTFVGTLEDMEYIRDPVNLGSGSSTGNVDGDPDSAFLIGLTSGTTSHPKMFYRARRSWSFSLTRHKSIFGLTPADRVLAPGPLSHGLTLYAAAEALTAGASFLFVDHFGAENVLRMIRTEVVTRLTLVPAMLHDLSEVDCAPLGSVTTILSAGAKLSESLRRRAGKLFPNAEILEYYGASELSFVTMTPRGEAGPPASIGKAFPGVTISIRDASGADEMADGSIGTLFVDSPLISQGYLGETAASGFTRVGRWASVGDRAWRDEAGFVYLAGRDGDVINCGGNSFYPAELEAVLLTCPGIETVCVFGLPDQRLGQIPVAVMEGGHGLTPAALQRHCMHHLARYKIPRRFYRTARLPRTDSGKVANQAVLAMIETGSADLIDLAS